MARPPSRYPTERELQMLQVLWQRYPLSARNVRLALEDIGISLDRRTVVSTLNTMVHKRKYLKRKKQRHMYVYSPRISEKVVKERILKDVVKRVFEGSANALVLEMFDCMSFKDEELKVLRRTVSRRLKKS
jgi:BlaI family penicillinase repressor